MLVKNHWLDRCRRAVRMDWEELRMRTRQEIAKRSDFLLGRMGVRFMKNGGAPWSQGCGRFFFWSPCHEEWLAGRDPSPQAASYAPFRCRVGENQGVPSVNRQPGYGKGAVDGGLVRGLLREVP